MNYNNLQLQIQIFNVEHILQDLHYINQKNYRNYLTTIIEGEFFDIINKLKKYVNPQCIYIQCSWRK